MRTLLEARVSWSDALDVSSRKYTESFYSRELFKVVKVGTDDMSN